VTQRGGPKRAKEERKKIADLKEINQEEAANLKRMEIIKDQKNREDNLRRIVSLSVASLLGSNSATLSKDAFNSGELSSGECDDLGSLMARMRNEVVSSEDTERGLKMDFLNDVLTIDKRSTIVHDNSRNHLFRDLDLQQKPQEPISLKDSVEIFWRSYKYFNSIEEPIIDSEIVGKLLYSTAMFSGDEAAAELQKVIARIPKAPFLILKSTICHFARMGSLVGGRINETLGAVFGASMFRTTNVCSSYSQPIVLSRDGYAGSQKQSKEALYYGWLDG
jgi:hypothetical protein